MNNKMITKIMDDAAKMEAADNLMTEALQALEVFDWETAYDKAMAVLEISDGVEQRLAALNIRFMAEAENARSTMAILRQAYDIEPAETITVMGADILAAKKALRDNDELLKANQAATDRLLSTLDDFNQAMLHIQARL